VENNSLWYSGSDLILGTSVCGLCLIIGCSCYILNLSDLSYNGVSVYNGNIPNKLVKFVVDTAASLNLPTYLMFSLLVDCTP